MVRFVTEGREQAGAKLVGPAYYAAHKSSEARAAAARDAGRLCENGEAWARRIGAAQSPYEFIELWWSLPASVRATPAPQSNGESCRKCKKPVKLGRRRFIARDSSTRAGRLKFLTNCDGGCMGGGVSVIVNKWADYGYEAEEEEAADDDGGATPRRGAVAAKRGGGAPRARRRPTSRSRVASLSVKKGDEAAEKPEAARRRAKPKKGAKKLLDLGARAGPTYDGDDLGKAAPRAPPAPREAAAPQAPPTMEAFPSLGGGSPRTVAAPPAWEPAYAPAAPSWEPAYATPEAPTYAPEAPSWSDPWAPEPEYFSREPEPYYAPEPGLVEARRLDLRLRARNNFHKLHGVKRKKCMACGKKRLASCPIVAMVGDWICGADGCVKHNFSKNLLATFLEAFGLRRHVARFREEEIQSLRDLPHLTLDDFIDMGLSFAEADTLASAAREML
ncbi:hypothetical protein SO694_000011136 [Aureococcus anophagefferens]|uniref:SAM domain-containing protein n=1 Tax=Aureococcus anophagefferens TaxID=44056 RepID=A0ABR1GBY1_AURAN